VGGAFPFAVPRFDGRGYSAVHTFPIVVEDETAPTIERRLAGAQKVIAQNGANGAPSVLLFHPSPSAAKLATWSTLLKTLLGNVWRGNLARYGTFWNQRMRSEITTSASRVCAGGRRVEVRAVNRGVTLRDQSIDVADRSLTEVRFAKGSPRRINADRKVELPKIKGGATLALDVCR